MLRGKESRTARSFDINCRSLSQIFPELASLSHFQVSLKTLSSSPSEDIPLSSLLRSSIRRWNPPGASPLLAVAAIPQAARLCYPSPIYPPSNQSCSILSDFMASPWSHNTFRIKIGRSRLMLRMRAPTDLIILEMEGFVRDYR